MEKFADKIKNMCREKLVLYKELQDIFEQEKNYIVDMDVDSLWKMTDRKKQLALKIEEIREKIFCLLEENNVPLNSELKFFNLSHVIHCLPFSLKIKSDLKKIKIDLDIVKKQLASLTSENKRYAGEYLSVIDGVFATLISSETKEQYNNTGTMLKDKTEKYFIRAEV